MKWISVKDSLPEKGEYLCVGHGGKRMICHFAGSEKGWHRQTWSKRVVGITHWMELPAAPDN